MAAFTPPPPIPDEDQGDLSSGGTPVRLLNYGPIVNEFHHAAMYGPNGNKLLPSDVAASPNLGYPLGTILDLGDGVQRRVADFSYRSPGVPTYNTIELRDRIADGHAIATPTPQVRGGFIPPPPIPDADQHQGTGPTSAQPVAQPTQQLPKPEDLPNPDPYAKELDDIAKNLGRSPGIKSQRDLEDLAARMPDFQQRQKAASENPTSDVISAAIRNNLEPFVMEPLQAAKWFIPTKENTIDPMVQMFTDPKKAFSRDVPLGSQEFYNELVGNLLPFLPHGIKAGLGLGAAGVEGIRARLSKVGTERGEAAAPAENPASSQSTILGNATQVEPPLDVKGTQGFARFQGEELVESGPEGPRLREKAELPESDLAKIGAEIPDESVTGPTLDNAITTGVAGGDARYVVLTDGSEHQVAPFAPINADGSIALPRGNSIDRSLVTKVLDENKNEIPIEAAEGQTNGWTGSPVEHGEFGQEGYTATEPKPQGNGAAPYGGANIGVQEQRPIDTPPPGTILGREKATALGNQWLDRGGDINKVIADFKRTRQVSEVSMGKMNAMLERIQAVVNQAGDALRNAPQNEALKAALDQALAREQAFTDVYKPMHTAASGSLATLQGTVPLTPEMAASYTGLRRQYGELRGKDFNGEANGKAVELSKKQSKANAEHAAANDELIRRADTEYGRIRTTRKGPPTLEDIGRTFGEGLKEVCDV